jgi:hypothetical protein
VKTTDEGRAAARRAEIRERLITEIAQHQRFDRHSDMLIDRLMSVVEIQLAECDRRSRAVEALRQAQDAGEYALALMRNRLSVEAPMNADIIRGYITKLEAALASPAPAAEDGDA